MLILFSHESWRKWKITRYPKMKGNDHVLEIQPFSTEPSLWEEGYKWVPSGERSHPRKSRNIHRLKSTFARDMDPPWRVTVLKGCDEKNNYLQVMLGDVG